MIVSESKIRKVVRQTLLEFELGGITMGDFGAKASKSVSIRVSTDVAERCIQLGQELGMDPAFIYATESKESNHKPEVMAWNLHIALDKKYAREAGVSPITPGKAKEMRKATLKFSHTKVGTNGASFYGSSARKAFDAAYKISPWHAIAGGAWGLYQVLGAYTLPKYGNNPQTWKAAFDNDPTSYSAESFRIWVGLPEKAGFKEAVNKGDYNTTTKMYYGKDDSGYRGYIKSRVLKWRQRKRDEGGSGGSGNKKNISWKGRLGKEVARGINFHKLIFGGPNNYRSGMKPKHVNATKEFFQQLKKDFGIETVITLNGDNGGKAANKAAKAAGLKTMYAPSSDSGGDLNMQNYNFNQIEAQLDKGNTLVHCTHGADRTGAVVGRYYIRKGLSVDKALANTYKYKSGGQSGYEKDGMGPTNYIKLG